MYSLHIKEAYPAAYPWELLCEYETQEAAFTDYLQLVEKPCNYRYVSLQKNGVIVAFFSVDYYYGIP